MKHKSGIIHAPLHQFHRPVDRRVLQGTSRGYFWNSHGPEEIAFSEAQLARGDTLVFARRTYDHIADFWLTPAAATHLPAIAGAMNRAEKIVVSNSLREALWGPGPPTDGDDVELLRGLDKAR